MVEITKWMTIYLSHKFSLWRWNSKVLDYTESIGNGPCEITRMKEFMNNRIKDRNYEVDIINYSDEVWTNEPSLLSGWMICVQKETSLMSRFRSFWEKEKAIEKMIKEKYSSIELSWGTHWIRKDGLKIRKFFQQGGKGILS